MPRTATVHKEDEAPPLALVEPPKEPPPLAIPAGWFAVDSEESPAPDNGRQIWLTDGEGNIAEGFWRHSRRRARSNGLWEQYAYWALCNGAGTGLPFTPKFWRPSNALIAQ